MFLFTAEIIAECNVQSWQEFVKTLYITDARRASNVASTYCTLHHRTPWMLDRVMLSLLLVQTKVQLVMYFSG